MNSPLNATLGSRMNAYLTSAEDFKKQRQRVNKSLLRLRHDLNLITRDTKNYKANEKISSITAQDYQKDSKHGLLLLLTAERDLLYALEIKNLVEISSEQTSGNFKKVVISKMRKALLIIKKLLDITSSESDLVKLELYIYAALIQGQLSTAKKQWALVLNSLSIAKCSLDFLYAQTTDQDSLMEFKTLIDELSDTIINPSLNLAVSQLENQGVKDNVFGIKSITRKHCHDASLPFLSPAIQIIQSKDASFVSEISSVALIKNITWRGHNSNLYNDEIAFRILSLTSSEWKSLTEPGSFDSLITGWTEVLELHELDLEKAQLNDDSDDLEKVQDRAILLTYIKYNLLFLKIRRDIIQAKHQQLVAVNEHKLIDGLILITEELKDLPGVFKDEELHASLDTLQKYFGAKRNVLLSDLYIQLEKYSEAVTILNYTKNDYLTEESYQTEFPYDVTSDVEFEQFKHELDSKLLKSHVLAQFAFELNGTNDKHAFLIENVDKCATSGLEKLINLDVGARLQPILCKPVLFDVGYNYINYETGSQAVKQAVQPLQGSEDEKKKGGFFGIFRS